MTGTSYSFSEFATSVIHISSDNQAITFIIYKVIVAYICYTYTTGSSALPDIYTQARGPQARGRVRIYWACAYISGKARVPVV